MILFYKNSFLASVVSILGCICILVIVTDFDSYTMEEIVPAMLAGIALLIGGKMISNRKVFKTWWKQVEKANLIDAIKTDVATAKMVYSKNPKNATLKKIEQLNPAAAAAIRASIGKK